MPENARKAMKETFYLIPIYIVLSLIMYWIFWKQKLDCTIIIYIYAMCGIGIGAIWIGVYFGIFFKQLSLDFQEARECVINRISIVDYASHERYAALQMQINIPGRIDPINTYACASNKKQDTIVARPYIYQFYEKGDEFRCGGVDNKKQVNININTLNSSYYSNSVGGSTTSQNTQSNTNTNSNDNSNQNPNEDRLLRRELNSQILRRKMATTTKKTTTSTSSTTSSKKSRCYYKQTFVEIKISAWNCMDYQKLKVLAKGKSDPIKLQNCYYVRYGDETKAKENAMDFNAKVENMRDFYMVTFESTPYYDKVAFLLFAGFCFMPFLSCAHFIWIPCVSYKVQSLISRFFSCHNNKIKNEARQQEIKKQPVQIEQQQNQILKDINIENLDSPGLAIDQLREKKTYYNDIPYGQVGFDQQQYHIGIDYNPIQQNMNEQANQPHQFKYNNQQEVYSSIDSDQKSTHIQKPKNPF